MHDFMDLLAWFSALAVLWLLVVQRRLMARMAALEAALEGRAGETSAPPAVSGAKDIGEEAPVGTTHLPQAGPARPSIVADPADTAGRARTGGRSIALLARIGDWLARNWFHAVAALSLVLAGLFATQYAAESGMISPGIRIALAALLGGALVAAGEVIRRRAGDGADGATAYLPSVFSGAGIVTLFGAVLAARALYGMIGPGTALAGLVAVALLAVVLGWFYGPVLMAVGLLGAAGAPFVVGGETEEAALLHGYFGLVAMAGLAVNALRRWPGIDALALAAPYAGACAVLALAGAYEAFLLLTLALAPLTVVMTQGSLRPQTPGAGPLTARLATDAALLTRPAAFLFVVWSVATAAVVGVAGEERALLPLAASGLLWLAVLPATWARGTAAAGDMAAAAAAGLLVLAVAARPGWLPIEDLEAGAEERWSLLALLAAGLGMSLAAAARSALSPPGGWQARGWALGAAVTAPALVAILEILWQPAALLGRGAWAGVAMLLATLATLFSVRAAATDGGDRFRTALGALVAFAMIALALFVSVSAGALSVALGVLVLAAAAFDDRWRLPALSPFVQVGTAVLVWRGLVDPGIAAALEAPLWDLALLQVVPLALVGAAWLLLRDADRPAASAAVEGGAAVLAALAATAAILRTVEGRPDAWDTGGHWIAGLLASVWLLSAAATLRGAGLAWMRHTEEVRGLRHRLAQALRYAAATAAILAAVAFVAFTLTFLHPFAGGQRVAGPILINTLLLAYALPGAILLAVALWLPGPTRAMRWAGTATGGALLLHAATLLVAHAWRGPDLAARGMGDGELWTYTAMLLLAGAALMVLSLRSGSRPLRLVANGLLGAAIAKVFLVDAPDLDGLVRAGSFLVLGLCLAGLAWLNRMAAGGGGPSNA